jgi:hypothetical protein
MEALENYSGCGLVDSAKKQIFESGRSVRRRSPPGDIFCSRYRKVSCETLALPCGNRTFYEASVVRRARELQQESDQNLVLWDLILLSGSSSDRYQVRRVRLDTQQSRGSGHRVSLRGHDLNTWSSGKSAFRQEKATMPSWNARNW